MGGQQSSVFLHERLIIHLRTCPKLDVLRLAEVVFGPDDKDVRNLRACLIENGTIPSTPVEQEEVA